MGVNNMKGGRCEREAGRLKFTIETLEMQGHCSAEKTILESREKNSIETKYVIVKELNKLHERVSTDRYLLSNIRL
jgi:hypothetical protein